MIKIIEGNLFDTQANIICHQCNCQGVMGSGVAAEVKRRYPKVYKSYRKDYLDGKLKLGYVNFAEAKENQVIANMCGQDKYGYDGKQYTQYEKLQECLNKVLTFAMEEYEKECEKQYEEQDKEQYGKRPTIAFPYLMSCQRGGGDWKVVYKMIEDTFQDYEVEIWKLNAKS